MKYSRFAEILVDLRLIVRGGGCEGTDSPDSRTCAEIAQEPSSTMSGEGWTDEDWCHPCRAQHALDIASDMAAQEQAARMQRANLAAYEMYGGQMGRYMVPRTPMTLSPRVMLSMDQASTKIHETIENMLASGHWERPDGASDSLMWIGDKIGRMHGPELPPDMLHERITEQEQRLAAQLRKDQL